MTRCASAPIQPAKPGSTCGALSTGLLSDGAPRPPDLPSSTPPPSALRTALHLHPSACSAQATPPRRPRPRPRGAGSRSRPRRTYWHLRRAPSCGAARAASWGTLARCSAPVPWCACCSMARSAVPLFIGERTSARITCLCVRWLGKRKRYTNARGAEGRCSHLIDVKVSHWQVIVQNAGLSLCVRYDAELRALQCKAVIGSCGTQDELITQVRYENMGRTKT